VTVTCFYFNHSGTYSKDNETPATVCTGSGKPGKSWKNKSLKKNYESIFIVYHDRQGFHWMYFTELRIISHGKDGKSNGKSHEKSWNFLQLKKYEPCLLYYAA